MDALWKAQGHRGNFGNPRFKHGLPALTGAAPAWLPKSDSMKFQLDQPQGGNIISEHDLRTVWVNGVKHQHSVLVPWQGTVEPWQVARFEDLEDAHFQRILALKPELVIFGSGSKIRFAKPALYRGLIEARIGMETMDLGAACRTYNVLASEGRAVLAALLIEG